MLRATTLTSYLGGTVYEYLLLQIIFTNDDKILLLIKVEIFIVTSHFMKYMLELIIFKDANALRIIILGLARL